MAAERLVIPASAFSITFGLAGLSAVWHLAAVFLGAPPAVATLLMIITLVVWGVLVALFLRRLTTGTTTPAAELTHPTTAPFLALVPLTLLVLVPVGAAQSIGAAAAVTVICGTAVLLLGAWLTGTWLGDGVPQESLHSGYYLPTVASGLITGTALASVGWRTAGIMAVGLGGICWLLLGSIINARTITAGPQPPALVPTMAIDVAPVVVAGNAWFALNGGVPDTAQLLLAGFAVLMVLVQVRLYLAVYRSLSFGPSFWAFTFSYCAVISYGLRWLATSPDGWSTAVSWLLVALITGFLLWVAVRSVGALRAGRFLPRESVPS